jgi:hypothetical protein
MGRFGMRLDGLLAKGNCGGMRRCGENQHDRFFIVRAVRRGSLRGMDDFHPEFEMPAAATGLRLFGWCAVLGAVATPVVMLDLEKLSPVPVALFWFSIFMAATVPTFMAAVAFGLAAIVENTARTAWELRIRRR